MNNTATTIKDTSHGVCGCDPDEPFCSCIRPVVDDRPVPAGAIPFDPFHRGDR